MTYLVTDRTRSQQKPGIDRSEVQKDAADAQLRRGSTWRGGSAHRPLRIDLGAQEEPPLRMLAPFAFGVELLICFGPLILLLGVGCIVWFEMISFSLAHGTFDIGVLRSTMPITLTNLAGICGLWALAKVLVHVVNPTADTNASFMVKCCIVAGLIPPVALACFSEWPISIVLGWLPIVASLHVLYVGRFYVFGTLYRQRGKRALHASSKS